MATERPLPPTIELCQRIRDGLPCLGRIHRSGTPEIACCTACGKRDAGAIYVLPAAIAEVLGSASLEASHDLIDRLAKAACEVITRISSSGEQQP